MTQGLAYLNHGRWVVDCPAYGCTDARQVYHPVTNERQTDDVCANGHPFTIGMPPEQLEAQIVAAVSERADAADRSWYPHGHTRALVTGQRTGQTVADLVEETREVAAFRASERTARHDKLRALVAELGLDFDPATGTVRGF